MTSSISAVSEDSKDMMMKMFQSMKTADTDGKAGLSLDELSSIDTSKDPVGGSFLQSLKSQFASLDKDSDGQLSAKEVSSVAPPSGPMGPPPGLSLGDSSSTTITGSTSATGSTDATGATSLGDSIEALIKDLLEKVSEKIESTVGSTASSATTATHSSNADKANSLISSADSDANGGVSLGELSSVNTSGNAGEAGFVKDLEKNFTSYDTNADGSLSQDEIVKAMPDSKIASDVSNLGHAAANLTHVFIDKMLSAYQSGGLSNLASTVNVAS